jgi:hypothetical protein
MVQEQRLAMDMSSCSAHVPKAMACFAVHKSQCRPCQESTVMRGLVMQVLLFVLEHAVASMHNHVVEMMQNHTVESEQQALMLACTNSKVLKREPLHLEVLELSGSYQLLNSTCFCHVTRSHLLATDQWEHVTMRWAHVAPVHVMPRGPHTVLAWDRCHMFHEAAACLAADLLVACEWCAELLPAAVSQSLLSAQRHSVSMFAVQL